MEHPKDVGDRTTLAVMLSLVELGYGVSVPFGENTRYDLVVENGHRLLRVQCKTGRLYDGVIVFRTASSYAHHPNPKPRHNGITWARSMRSLSTARGRETCT